jgi:hypothetical protein
MSNERHEPDTRILEEDGPEIRTTASAGHSGSQSDQCCERCGRPVTGRRQQFCSGRCRMQERWEAQRQRRMLLLDVIDAAVEELRQELEGGDAAARRWGA